MWFAVWPGVVTASSVQPSPLTTSPSASATSGRKSMSAEASSRGALADMKRPSQPMRPLRVDCGAGRRLDLGHRGRMIAMGVGDENMGDGLAAHRVEQRRDMGVVVGAGIEDRHLAAADDVADRALEGERARDCWPPRRAPAAPPRRRSGLEIESFVERDVVAHAGLHRQLPRRGLLAGLQHARQSMLRPSQRRPPTDRKRCGWLMPRRERQGGAQNNRAPVPGMPGLQQPQFITVSETEIAPTSYANGGPSSANAAKRRLSAN